MNEKEPAADSMEEEMTFNCPHCDKIFKKHFNLTKHIYKEHVKPTCTGCGNCFSRMKELKEHALNTHGVKMNKLCSICKKAYSTRRDLENHLQVDHEQDKARICPKCPRIFISEERLKKHTATIHSKNKSLRCSDCSKILYSFSKLKRHMEEEHAENKTLECPKCGDTFQANENLCKRICQLHLEARPKVDEISFNCNYCEEVFEKRRMVGFHVRKEHADKCIFNCEKCSFIFENEEQVKRHIMIRHTRRNFKCRFCYRRFWKKVMLQKHESMFHENMHNEDEKQNSNQNELSEISEVQEK